MGAPSLRTKRPSALALIISMSEQVVMSSGARAHLQIDRHLARAIDQVMPVAAVLWKGRTFTGAQRRLSAFLDQDQFALQNMDEFVLMAVPVSLARPAARRQMHQIDAEVAQAAGIAESLPGPVCTGRIIGRRITRAPGLRYGGQVDLRHKQTPLR
jgi:hypothetical protein